MNLVTLVTFRMEGGAVTRDVHKRMCQVCLFSHTLVVLNEK